MADTADTVPDPGTEDPAAARRRPWKVTYAGGRTLTTFGKQDKALMRAHDVVQSGRLRSVWVHERGSSEMIEVTRKRNQPPRSADVEG